MKKIVYKYQISKFKRFMNGLIFAIISIIALTLCITGIVENTTSDIILPFFIGVVSMVFGFYTMFWERSTSKQKA